MIPKLTHLIPALLISVPVLSQKTHSGKVFDAESRQPLNGVSVILYSKKDSVLTQTNENGIFVMSDARDFTRIRTSIAGYKATITEILPGQEITILMHADQVTLKDITVESRTANKFNTLSKLDLLLRPVRNTQELLRIVPGLFIAQHAGGGKAEQIFLRGFDCDHGTDIQVSVDGMPVNMVSHAHGQGYADAHFIIPETINYIDFAAGPYNAAQGNLNTAGYVSFATFKSIPRSMVQLEAGQYNSFRSLVMLDLLKKIRSVQSAYLASEINYSDGATIHKQHLNRINVFARYNRAFSSNTQLSLTLSAFSSKWDASGQVPERGVASGMIRRFGSIDPSEGGSTRRYNANLQVTTQYSNGNSLQHRFYYSRYLFGLYSNFTFFLNDPVNGDAISQSEARNIFGYQFQQKNSIYKGSLVLHSVTGIGFRYDDVNNSRLSSVVKRQLLADVQRGDINEFNGYAFTNQQYSIGKWLLEGGLRFDLLHFRYTDQRNGGLKSSLTRSILSPKLNIQFTPNNRVQLYLKAGKGFHSNDTRVVLAADAGKVLPAAYGADLGLVFKPTGNLYLNIAFWNLYLEQEFVYVGDAGVVEPGGRTRRLGIDISSRFQLNRSFFGNIGINLARARALGKNKGEDFVPLAPSFTGTGSVGYRSVNGFNASLSGRYMKNRPANEDNSIIAKGYFVTDAAINYTTKKFSIGISVENLFNVKWNEAQFATESRLYHEQAPVNELHFTPGTPFSARMKISFFF